MGTDLATHPRAATREGAIRLAAAICRSRPDARVELDHADPYQLLIATILSAQSTDARVNIVTRDLFRTWPDPVSLSGAPRAKVEAVIRSSGFFRAKAKSIQGCARALVERHGGLVPRTMEELVRLPGVGRKTANVVLGAGYGIAAGIVVDTHMARVARRLGLTGSDDPVAIERDLMAIVPPADWIAFSIAGVLHGRHVCQARRPRCTACPIADDCPSRDSMSEGAVGPEPRPGVGAAGARRPAAGAIRRAADRGRPRPRGRGRGPGRS